MEPRKVGHKSKRPASKKQPELSSDEEMSFEDEEIDCTAKKNKAEDGEDWEDEEITVEFEFYEPNPNQFFSIKSLINGFLDGLSYRSSDLAQLIIEQKELGTMIGAVEDEEEKEAENMEIELEKGGNKGKNKPENDKMKPETNMEKSILGFASILSFQEFEKQKVFQEIYKYLEEKSRKHNEKHEELFKILLGSNVGLFINERIINLSPKLVPMLHGQILKDLETAQNNRKTEEKSNIFFNFDYILGVTKIFKDISVPAPKKKKNDLNFNDFIFQKFEDFAFLQKAYMYFMFPGATSKNSAGITNLEAENNKEQCYRLIWLITMKDFDQVANGLVEYLEA